MAQETSGTRDREQTKERLIEAAIGILREKGFESLGVNAVAERAGVSKVLIYRYFGDYDGLLRVVAGRVTPLDSSFAERMLQVTEGDPSPANIIRTVVHGLHRVVAENQLLQQVLIWELSAENELTAAMARQREETGVAQTEALRSFLRARGVAEDLDVDALIALVTAGVFYLTLRSRQVETFNGVDLRSEAGWDRIASALTPLVSKKS